MADVTDGSGLVLPGLVGVANPPLELHFLRVIGGDKDLREVRRHVGNAGVKFIPMWAPLGLCVAFNAEKVFSDELLLEFRTTRTLRLPRALGDWKQRDLVYL